MATPAEIKIAELQAEIESYHELTTRQSELLSSTVRVFRGPEPPRTMWSHADVAELAEKAIMELRELRAASGAPLDKWVAVGARLPEPNTQVWVVFHHPNGYPEGRTEVRRAFFRPDGIWDEFLWERITHWQPLYVPEPSPPLLLAAPSPSPLPPTEKEPA